MRREAWSDGVRQLWRGQIRLAGSSCHGRVELSGAIAAATLLATAHEPATFVG
jgi:hypothetical protein